MIRGGRMSQKEKNLEIQKKNQNDLRTLEQIFTGEKLDVVLKEIEKHKEKLVNEMISYAESHTQATKWDRDGCAIEYGVKLNPLVINNYFFKPIVPIGSIEPEYNAEKLALVFDYYCDLITEVNDKIGHFPSSLTSFCKMAGITLSTLRSYKNSPDINMRIITEKIYDQIGDTNITMSQLGMVNERSTIFKMKSQNEIVEKVQPTVNINIVETPDMEQIEDRINKYKVFAGKKGKK